MKRSQAMALMEAGKLAVDKDGDVWRDVDGVLEYRCPGYSEWFDGGDAFGCASFAEGWSKHVEPLTDEELAARWTAEAARWRIAAEGAASRYSTYAPIATAAALEGCAAELRARAAK